MKIISETVRAEREMGAVLAALREQHAADTPLPLLLNGLAGGALWAAAAELARESAQLGHKSLLLVPDDAAARRLTAFLLAAGLRAAAYPARDFVLHPIVASHALDRERLFVLHSLLAGEIDTVVATPGAALQFTLPPARLSGAALSLSVGTSISPTALAARLTALGYTGVDAVEGEGQFARRGGILDIFPTGAVHPVRLEFFGDDIERIDSFDVRSQRRFAPLPALTLLPVAEVTADPAARAAILREIESNLATAKGEGEAALRAERAAVEGGLSLSFADKYISLIYPTPATLLDYLSTRPTVLLLGTDRVRESLRGTLSLCSESVLSMLEAGVLSAPLSRYYETEATLDAYLSRTVTLHLNSFAGGVGQGKVGGLFGFRCRRGVSYADKPDLLLDDLRTLLAGGFSPLLLTDGAPAARAQAERLREAGLLPVPLAPDASIAALPAGAVGITYTDGVLEMEGYELPLSRIAVLSLLSGGTRVSRTPRRRLPAGQRLFSYAELREGDYVVHAVHGIGRFGGMTTLTVDGATRDYITLHYAGTDKLFLPADRLEMISRYIGAEGEGGRVKLSRLGGSEWQKTRSRAKASAREMARELIALYAARQRRPGHAFSAADQMQRDFEAAFPYEETEGQLLAWGEIEADMEKPTPMDRLLCGDVGYGKTELALRAAFKAVADGKQVAILVPTTILAMQHYETTLARMRGFPVTVEMLTRLRTPRQEAQILRRTARGEVDILIGTHKLLSKNLAFRDLGLLIVDEEQRFGVAQKEKLKAMAGNVDVLTLTATPIPRTLNMAISGIRDMSLLDEAPTDRRPVETYVLPHDDLMILEAIRRELRRGGQVIYLYNRVDTMARTEARLTAALPDARIVSAHGRMERGELEEIWAALVRGEIDVILCTTIVETGVDLPNANTLIIEDADRLGLSQLHQIRGRVGRSGRQAYAYFTYRAGKALSEVAEKRLHAIREYAAFGAGFQIALRDMEIRGAGNLLGAEQHGNIEAVGYELYVRLLAEAVLEEQGATPPPPFASHIDLRIDAHIPDTYLASSARRMELYKKISAITCEADRADILDEMTDRYGTPPRPVLRLLDVALARAMAERARIPRVEWAGGTLTLTLERVELDAWSVLFAARHDLAFSKTTPPRVHCHAGERADPAALAAELLCALVAVLDEQKETKGEDK